MSDKPHGPVSERFMRHYYGASKSAAPAYETAKALAAPADCPRKTDEIHRWALCSRCHLNREAHALRDLLNEQKRLK